jgi:hypothetical protein
MRRSGGKTFEGAQFEGPLRSERRSVEANCDNAVQLLQRTSMKSAQSICEKVGKSVISFPIEIRPFL